MAIDLILILMLIFLLEGRGGGGWGVISIILEYKLGHPKKVPMKKRVIIFYSTVLQYVCASQANSTGATRQIPPAPFPLPPHERTPT